MDLDSWSPNDKARRLAVVIAMQIAVFMFVLVWLALSWPWYLVLITPVATYLMAHSPAFVICKWFFRR